MLNLTREQRYQLVHADKCPLPKIDFEGDEPCPVAVGYVQIITPHVSLEVTEIRKTAEGKHSLGYTLHNARLGQRFMSSRRGADYAYSGGSDTDREAGESVDAFTQKRITREARDREREAAGQLIVAAEELRAALRDRIEASPEFMKLAGRDVWLIRSKLDRLVRNAKRRAA